MAKQEAVTASGPGNEYDRIQTPDGPIWLARVGPMGYARHEPLFQPAAVNRKGRRAAAARARRR